MSLIEFESAREKEKKRQWEREARNAILEKAKSKYESEKLREEERKQRGEHTWMLPSIEARLDSSSSSKKKKKKDKKKKKKKTKKRKDSSSSSSSESDENEMWVEKPSAYAPDKPVDSSAQLQQQEPSQASKRDGWMEMTSLFKTYSRDEIKEMDGTSRKKEKEEEKRRKQEADKPGSHARELNPYYKNGGTGLPEESQRSEKLSSSPALGLDAAWLRKALQRAKEQAQAENKTLEEVAAQRWGSLAKFNELLAEAEGRSSFRDRDPWHRKSGTSRDDSLRRERNRSKSRERRSRSRERRDRERDRRSRSRERISSSKSRRDSRERERSRSIERRDKDRERRRSRSRDRVSGSSKSRRVSRDRSRERESRYVGRKQGSRDRKRSQSKDRDSRDKGSHRRRYSSSGSSSSSESDSSSSSGSCSDDRKRHSSNSYKAHTSSEGSHRSVSGLMKPPDEEKSLDTSRSSLLSAKFHKPGEDIGHRSSSSFSTRGSSSSSQSWRKKEYAAEKPRMQEKPRESSSSSSSESSDEEVQPTEVKPGKTEYPEKPPTEQKILTDKEMNELAAKIMKAELVGNDNLANKLKNKLEAARSAKAKAPSDSKNSDEKGDSSREEVVVLMRTDAKGFSRPVAVTDSETGRKKQEKMKTHDKDGKRSRYFPDDDKYDLKQMFEAEKGTTAEDQNSMFSRAAMQNNQKLDEDYDMDDMFMSKAVMKESSAKQAERDKKRAIQEHQRSQRSLESCQWCFENKEMAKHLIVALGTKAYVCLPPHESLTAGHCLIIPIHHVMCSVQADEDLWSEIMNFRRSLVKMFNSRDEDCIFFETAKRFRHYPHMVINCVPLPRETGDMAPIYFKKAIMECEAEWAQNKKLVDLKNRDVRRAVPKGLPYFFVDFAMDPGYAHVIEDEQEFPYNFAQEIVGGMLDLENNLWRKPRKENFDAQRRKVIEFSRWYKEYDITQDDES